MTNVQIIFATDERIVNNETRMNYVAQQKQPFCSLLLEDQQVVVVKETKEPLTLEKVRALAGNIARSLTEQKVQHATLAQQDLITAFKTLEMNETVTAFTEGWQLGSYQFTKYQSKQTNPQTALTITDADEQAVAAGKIRAAAMAFSRDLMNEVSNELNPETYPKLLQEKFEDTPVEVRVFHKKQLKEMKMNGVLTVGRGSKYKPAFVELIYQGDPSKPLIALVGKGVTFDTGGISLKSGKDLSDMRMDMGGSAAVAGAIQLLADMKADVNVVGLLPIVENAPDKKSVYPGEVIQYKNGMTVQVGNTDAEGRLILADGLIRAGEWEAEYVVDIATLTGAIVQALGTEMAGVFGDEALTTMMRKIGERNGDFVWPMPLVEAYDETLSSDYADFRNISSMNYAGSITAGLFLRRFVPEQSRWVHVDMAGVMDKTKASGYYTKSATGFGARLLADFAVHISAE